MSAFSHTPFSRPYMVGFETLLRELAQANSEKADTYPPHNIVKVTDDSYLIELAIAGFSEDEIEIQVDNTALSITGKKEDTRDFVYKGISSRAFRRDFRLAEYVEVAEATYSNGILQIVLERKIPDAKKPKKIVLKK